MYIYFLLYLTVLILALLSLKRDISDFTIALVVIVITALMVFRYGQGTDYFAYNYLIERNITFHDAFTETTDNHGEIGFRILAVLFHGRTALMLAAISLYDMAMTARFLWKHCTNKAFTLLLFVPSVLLTYYFSAIRQGIVLATFLGAGISLVERKAWKRYMLMCLALAMVHSVALVLLAVPFLEKVSLKAELAVFLPLSMAVGILISIPATRQYLLLIPVIGRYISIYPAGSVGIGTIANRIITLVIMMLFYYSWKEETGLQEDDPWWIKAYLFGQILYFALMPYMLIATRVYICFKVLELWFVPNMMLRNNRYRQIVAVYFIMLMTFVYVSNINSCIREAGYNDSVNCINYPYISVFNKEDIWEYRAPDQYYQYIR